MNQISSRLKPSDIAAGYISRLEEVDGSYLSVKKSQAPKPEPHVDRALKPPFSFEKSSIRSLSKHIEDSFLAEGIKMVTHEEYIIEDKSRKESPLFKIQEEDVVK